MTPRRPRVVLLCGNGVGAMDGVAHYTSRLAQQLAEARPDWDWFWFGKRRSLLSRPFLRQGQLTILQPNHSWFPPHHRLAKLAIQALRPGILHIQDQIHSFFQTGAAAAIARSVHCPVAVTLHEYHLELPSIVHTDALVQRADFIAASDARTAQRVATHAHRPADQIWWSPSYLIPPPDPIPVVPGLCVTFGLLSGIKNLAIVRRALEIVRQEMPHVRWRIVGPFEPDTNADHAELGETLRADWIEFTGSRAEPNDPILQRWLAEAAVMLLPFADGASPRRTSLQAGWAFGLPVVTTPPSVDEPAILPGENCLLAPPEDAAAWARQIRAVLGDEALAARLRSGSLAAAEHHSWDRLTALHLKIYERLLARGGRGSS